MTPNEPSNPHDDPGPVTEHDALRRLEERLDRASDAAERLISEAARAAAAARTRAAGSGASQAGDPDEAAAAGPAGQPGTRDDAAAAGGAEQAEDRGAAETARGQDAAETARGQDAAETARGQDAAETARGQDQSAKPPPAGWQLPKTDGPESARNADVELLTNVLQALRDLIPPELQERLATALRELLLALRALIDWYIDRMERRRAQPAEVEDIPIL